MKSVTARQKTTQHPPSFEYACLFRVPSKGEGRSDNKVRLLLLNDLKAFAPSIDHFHSTIQEYPSKSHNYFPNTASP